MAQNEPYKGRLRLGWHYSIRNSQIKHNAHHKGFTGQAADWEIVYSEPYSTKSEALKREKEIKRWKSRAMVERLVKSKQ